MSRFIILTTLISSIILQPLGTNNKDNKYGTRKRFNLFNFHVDKYDREKDMNKCILKVSLIYESKVQTGVDANFS